MTKSWRTGGVALCLLGAAASASGQGDRSPEATRGTELAALVAVASTGSHTGSLVGGHIAWQWSRRVTAEARAAWLDRGRGADGFAADVGGTVALIAPRTVTPVVGAGFGLYRASFDRAGAPLPDFYRRRLGTGVAPANRSFTDPALRVTAGVDLKIGRRVSIRPEASALMAFDGGRSQTLGVFGVRVGYRFEDRPITPTR